LYKTVSYSLKPFIFKPVPSESKVYLFNIGAMLRSLVLLCFFLASQSFVVGQNYYVALVKGNVYYQDKLLKKRDKIKLKGTLKFTTKNDYVRISGPGGLYTIKPEQGIERGNEFLVAVKEELFPATRALTTAVHSFVPGMSNYFKLDESWTYTFFNETHFYEAVPPLKANEEYGFLHFTNQGLIYRKARVQDSLFVIRKEDFALDTLDGKAPYLHKTAMVWVKDKSRWMEAIKNIEYPPDFQKYFPPYDGEIPEYYFYRDDPLTEENLAHMKTAPGAILDVMGAFQVYR
jgi:hypothetical protein